MACKLNAVFCKVGLVLVVGFSLLVTGCLSTENVTTDVRKVWYAGSLWDGGSNLPGNWEDYVVDRWPEYSLMGKVDELPVVYGQGDFTENLLKGVEALSSAGGSLDGTGLGLIVFALESDGTYAMDDDGYLNYLRYISADEVTPFVDSCTVQASESVARGWRNESNAPVLITALVQFELVEGEYIGRRDYRKDYDSPRETVDVYSATWEGHLVGTRYDVVSSDDELNVLWDSGTVPKRIPYSSPHGENTFVEGSIELGLGDMVGYDESTAVMMMGGYGRLDNYSESELVLAIPNDLWVGDVFDGSLQIDSDAGSYFLTDGGWRVYPADDSVKAFLRTNVGKYWYNTTLCWQLCMLETSPGKYELVLKALRKK